MIARFLKGSGADKTVARNPKGFLLRFYSVKDRIAERKSSPRLKGEDFLSAVGARLTGYRYLPLSKTPSDTSGI